MQSNPPHVGAHFNIDNYFVGLDKIIFKDVDKVIDPILSLTAIEAVPCLVD